MARKIYVCVTLYADESGNVYPQSLFFDGKEYLIDRIASVRYAPPQFTGGALTKRYDCMISGKLRKLYREGDRWFIETNDQKNE